MIKPKRIAVALSGGVDSSVSALLLKRAGFDVTAVFMKNWSKSKISPYCTEEADRKDALRVATKLKIPFEVWDFESAYKKRVMDVFFSEYHAGRTPNPDILCNREIKFGLFLQRARQQGFAGMATGHYARIRSDNKGNYHLLAGRDSNKDQTYFLVDLDQATLPFVRFPVGELTKHEVRRLAKQASLPTADKPDSQGICFVGPVNLFNFLKTRLRPKPGSIVTGEGQIIGRHEGLSFYTIGQRQGLGIGGAGIPYYVASKDFKHNRLIVGHGRRDPILYSASCVVKRPHWVLQKPKLPFKCQVRIRYRQPLQTALISPPLLGRGVARPLRLAKQGGRGWSSSSSVQIAFNSPQWAVTPGQYAVFYQGEEVIGGGVIDD